MSKFVLKSVFSGRDVEFADGDAVVLALESSCDETACAIIKNGREVLSNVVASQIKTHQQFGGVVPEVAAREHLEAVNEVISQALNDANIKADDITAVAATEGPGLVGSLLVGFNAAKTFAMVHDKPFIAVNHLEAHVCANYLNTELKPPFLALLVSGGHTQIILISDYNKFEIIGETIDDAAGEAFDKVARLLGLPYPGGANLDKLAEEGNPSAYVLPKAKVGKYDFSFSGLKTAVLMLTKKNSDLNYADVAASFRQNVVDVLLKKLDMAAQEYNINTLAIAGGVAANKLLRENFKNLEKLGYKIFIPEFKYCTDNAAMIGACAYFHPDFDNNIESEVFSRI